MEFHFLSSSTSYPILGRRLRAGNLILSARPSLTLAPLQKWAPEALTLHYLLPDDNHIRSEVPIQDTYKIDV